MTVANDDDKSCEHRRRRDPLTVSPKFCFCRRPNPERERGRERERGGRRTRFFPPSVLRSRTRGLGRRPALGLALLTLEKVRGEEGIVEQSEKMESTARRAARHLGEFLVEISFTCGRGGGIDLIAQSTPAMF